MRALNNTLAVLIATALTAIALYTGVQAAAGTSSRTSSGRLASATALAGQTYVCPATGCTSTSCHAIAGTSASTQASSASSSGSGTTMTCPRTGCTASTCHGATHSPPPTVGGSSGSSQGGGFIWE